MYRMYVRHIAVNEGTNETFNSCTLHTRFVERLRSVINEEFLNVIIEVCGKRIGMLRTLFAERLGNVDRVSKCHHWSMREAYRNASCTLCWVFRKRRRKVSKCHHWRVREAYRDALCTLCLTFRKRRRRISKCHYWSVREAYRNASYTFCGVFGKRKWKHELLKSMENVIECSIYALWNVPEACIKIQNREELMESQWSF